jgi:hypothetical protein
MPLYDFRNEPGNAGATQCPNCEAWFNDWTGFINHAEDGCGQEFMDQFNYDYLNWHAKHIEPYADCYECYPNDPRWA